MRHRFELERLAGLLATFGEVVRTIASEEAPMPRRRLAGIESELARIAERLRDIVEAAHAH